MSFLNQHGPDRPWRRLAAAGRWWAALALGALSLAGGAAAQSGQPGPWTPYQSTWIRLEANGDVACYSRNNGYSCDWSGPARPPAGPMNTLRCGDAHQRLYGTTGYDTAGHWCRNGTAMVTDTWRTNAGWVFGQTPEGDTMCFSLNGINCENAQRYTSTPVAQHRMLACGETHRQYWGVTGYDTPGHWCTTGPRSFSVAITSDPQYPWRNEGGVPSTGSETGDSQVSIPLVYDSINRYHSERARLLGTFVNGDVTAYGHPDQWDYMRGALGRLRMPVFLGLGNHDYENNVNNCWENRCVRGSLQAMMDYVPRDASFDAALLKYYEFPTNVWEYKGSFAWSKDIGGVHFVVLNNSPTYGFQASSYYSARAVTTRFNIKSALPWLQRDLKAARAAGKPIVLVYHKPYEYRSADGHTMEQFEQMVRRYRVGAIFWGHIHGSGGVVSQVAGVPAIYSGSATTQTHLFARFERRPGQPSRMTVDLSRRGAIDNLPRVGQYDLPTVAEEVQDVLPEPARQVRVINNGGYVARFRAAYNDASGVRRELRSSELPVGQTWTVGFPAGTTERWVWAEVKTGLVWSPWHRIFTRQVTEDACYKVWGTTLSTSWGNC